MLLRLLGWDKLFLLGSSCWWDWGYKWSRSRSDDLLWALDIVLFYSEWSATGTGCWWGGLSWAFSDVDFNDIFDIMDIAFIPLFDLITSVVVVKRSVFDMRLCEGAGA